MGSTSPEATKHRISGKKRRKRFEKSHKIPTDNVQGKQWKSKKTPKKVFVIGKAPYENEADFVSVKVNGNPFAFQVDTGALQTVLTYKEYLDIPHAVRPRLLPVKYAYKMADGETDMNVYGMVELVLEIGGIASKHMVLIADMKGVSGLLGNDFLKPRKVDVCYSDYTLTWPSQGVKVKMSRSKSEVISHSVVTVCRVIIQPGEEMEVPVKQHRPMKHADAMIDPSMHFVHKTGVLPARTHFDGTKCNTIALLYNPSDDEIEIGENEIIGFAGKGTPVEDDDEGYATGSDTESDVIHTQGRTGPVVNATYVEPGHEEEEAKRLQDIELPEYLEDLYERSAQSIEEMKDKITLRKALNENREVFSKHSDDIGRTHVIEHRIETGDHPPIRQKLRRQGLAREKLIEDCVQNLKRRGLVEDSESDWASIPVVCAKPDGTARFCVSYKGVNSLAKPQVYPMPKLDDCLDSLYGKRYYCSLDLQQAYWQVPLRESDKEKTAFLTKSGLYQWTVLPFGLQGAPFTFEKLMERVLRGLQWEKCLIYLDDLLVMGSSFNECLENLIIVLQRLKSAGLKLKPKKCKLFQREVSFLGHVISEKMWGYGGSENTEFSNVHLLLYFHDFWH